MRAFAFAVVSLVSSACALPGSRAPHPPLKYPLLNPLIAADSDVEFNELRPFDRRLKARIDEYKKKGQATHVSLLFRDMRNGFGFNVDGEEKFSPASLLKTPLMIATLKMAQDDPGLLARKVRNDQVSPVRTDFDEHALKKGEEYTVDRLLQAMIGASDNDATVMLRTLIHDDALNAVFSDFGLVIPEVRSVDDSMNVREYGTFFRVLYNASYLDKRMSQKALDLLAASEFKAGLVAGVPPGVVVAHKFGERSFDDKKTKQLHDCGIVYHASTEYLLCVMTRGEDFKTLAAVIAGLSKAVYEEVDAQQQRR